MSSCSVAHVFGELFGVLFQLLQAEVKLKAVCDAVEGRERCEAVIKV